MNVTDFVEQAKKYREAVREVNEKVKKDLAFNPMECRIHRGNFAALIYFEEWDGSILIQVGTEDVILDTTYTKPVPNTTFPVSGITTEFLELLDSKFKEAINWVQGKAENFPTDDCEKKHKKRARKALKDRV